jgi:hypothetical protein
MDYDTPHPLTDHASVWLMEVSKFRATYTDRFIKHLDQPTIISEREYTLRSILHDLTFLLSSSDTLKAKPLFHTVDYPTSGPDVGKGVIYFTAYHNQSDIGERLVAILPAYVQTFVDKQAAKQWFHPGTLQSLSEVFFGYDDEGNWDGTWHTAEDDLAQDILDEDMGIEFNFDNLDDLENRWQFFS